MKKFFFTLGVAALTTLSVFTADAQITEDYENNHVGKIFQQAKVDLNNDGRKETVALKSFRKLGDYGDLLAKIVVFDADGKVIFRGPEITNLSDNRHLGCFNHGTSILDLIADIDGDGRLEMLIALPQSDVRPRTYAVWRWENNQFKYLYATSIMSRDNQQFKFMPAELDYEGYSFVVGFDNKIYAPGQPIKARVLDFIKGYGNYNSKDMIFVPNAQGFRAEQQ